MDAEERDKLRELAVNANASRAWVPSFEDAVGPYEVLLLLDALDAAEAREKTLRDMVRAALRQGQDPDAIYTLFRAALAADDAATEGKA